MRRWTCRSVWRAGLLLVSTGLALQVGACSADTLRINATVVGNLVANAFGFFLNNAIVRGYGG